MMDNNKMICYCDQVTKGEIIEAMEKGAKTLFSALSILLQA